MTATSTSRQSQSQSGTPALMWLLFLADAGLLIASGAIHFHLWEMPGGYRTVPTLRILFLVQGAACVLAAIALLVTRHLLIVAGSALLMAGTIAGFILARTVGIFGFKLPFSTTEANIVLGVEIAAIVLLAATALLLRRQRNS
ncbi:MAG TPA: hypothetical protein VFQ44_23165 [Streptosporangiaceae bacterium]|nr:hypothetical protein [Streptosporangiaceae bacterium]